MAEVVQTRVFLQNYGYTRLYDILRETIVAMPMPMHLRILIGRVGDDLDTPGIFWRIAAIGYRAATGSSSHHAILQRQVRNQKSSGKSFPAYSHESISLITIIHQISELWWRICEPRMFQNLPSRQTVAWLEYKNLSQEVDKGGLLVV
jgi:hypothetical protein